jgi:hypothetical protein
MDSFQQSFPSSIMQCWLCHTSSRPNFVTPSDWARKNDELSTTIFSCVPVQYSLLERMLFIDYSNSNDVIDCWSSRSLFNSDIHCFSSDLKLKKKKDPCMYGNTNDWHKNSIESNNCHLLYFMFIQSTFTHRNCQLPELAWYYQKGCLWFLFHKKNKTNSVRERWTNERAKEQAGPLLLLLCLLLLQSSW